MATAAKALSLKSKAPEAQVGLLPWSSENDPLWQQLQMASFEAPNLAILLENDARDP